MSHPSHKSQLASLVRNSLATVEGKILKTHLRECVKDSLDGGENFEEKVEELLKVLKR